MKWQRTTSYLVLVADLSQARLYTLASPQAALARQKGFVNPAARQSERELGTSPPGRVMSRAGSGAGAVRGAYEPRHTHKENAEDAFVRRVAAAVDKALAAALARKPATWLVLVAAPQLLGQFRRYLSPGSLERLAVELRRDLGKTAEPELAERIHAAILATPGARSRSLQVLKRSRR